MTTNDQQYNTKTSIICFVTKIYCISHMLEPKEQ